MIIGYNVFITVFLQDPRKAQITTINSVHQDIAQKVVTGRTAYRVETMKSQITKKEKITLRMLTISRKQKSKRFTSINNGRNESAL